VCGISTFFMGMTHANRAASHLERHLGEAQIFIGLGMM